MGFSKVIISVNDLSSGYDKKPVFENLSFDIHENETFGLIGLNGSGKTTLIKTILGLRDPFSGSVTVKGHGGRNSNISFLPERFEPPWFLSGYEFIKFSLSLYDKKISYEELEDFSKKVSLDPLFLNKKVQSYSKGMRQKLGLLATVLTKCPLLVLDEPMSGLDPKARFEVKSLINEIKKQGHSIFMSSHILSDMAEMCDRVAVFNDGKFIFVGTPKEMIIAGGKKNLEESFLNIINVTKEAA